MSQPNFESRAARRQAQKQQNSATARKVGVGVLALALLGCGGWYLGSRGDDSSAQAARPQQDCAQQENVTLAVAPGVYDAVKDALDASAQKAEGPDCTATFNVTKVTDTELAAKVSSGEDVPMWITDSSSAAAEVSKAAKKKIQQGTVVASSPIVVAGPAQQIDKLGSTGTTWQKVLSAQPAATVDDATTDAGSALAVTDILGDVGTNSQNAARFGQLALGATPDFSTASPHIATEADVVHYNSTSGANLKEVGIQGGSPAVKVYATQLITNDGNLNKAFASLTKQLTSGAGRASMSASGYRAADGKQAPSKAPVGAQSVSVGAAPKDAQVAQSLGVWKAAVAPLQLTSVVDVSGSMDAEVNGASRIDMVVKAANEALGVMPSTYSVGLWEFSQKLDGDKDYRELVPLAELDSAQRNRLQTAVGKLPGDVNGGTGLYNTIWAAYQAAQKSYKPGSISTLMLVTDGRNEVNGGLTLQELETKLKGIIDKNRPVDISPVAIGNEADVQVLSQIAKMTGGKVYFAKTPQDVPQVLQQSLLDRK